MFGLAKSFAAVWVLLLDIVFLGCKFSPIELVGAPNAASTQLTLAGVLKKDELQKVEAGKSSQEVLSLNALTPKPAFSCVTMINEEALSCADYYRDFAVGAKKIGDCESLNSLLADKGQLRVVNVARCEPSAMVKGCLVADADGLTKKIWWYPQSANEARYCAKVHRGVVFDPKPA